MATTVATTLDLSEYIRVTNRTGSVIKGRYDGVEYIFENEKPTDIHHLAATHIFGYDQKDKTNAFIRLGWLAAGLSMDEACAKIDDIVFGDVPAPPVDIAPGKPRARRFKTGSPTPLADAGADDGAGDEPAPPEAAGAAE